jgi:hypothetical protein
MIARPRTMCKASRSTPSRRKACLVAVGMAALSRGDMVMVRAITRRLWKEGLGRA